MAVDWLFFDVGSVLMDETVWFTHYYDHVFTVLQKYVPELTLTQYELAKEAGEQQTHITTVQYILQSFLSDPRVIRSIRREYWESAPTNYYQMNVPAHGIQQVLSTFSSQFRMGIIANQHPPVLEWLERHDLKRYFEVYAFDFEIGISKPDTRLFMLGLQKAGCLPSASIMVGDRLDNDVRPAKEIGMKTIRVRQYGEYKRMEPATAEETPDANVLLVSDLVGAVQLICTDTSGE